MRYISYEYTFMVIGLVKRKIVEIDEEKCNGCGECIPNCAEGALKIVNGKAKIIKDEYCDGLGACLGHCPQDAIKIIEREASQFDEEAVHEHLESMKKEAIKPACDCGSTHAMHQPVETEATDEGSETSSLRQWPIQLNLVPIRAPYWENADLLIMADCVAVAYPDLHRRLLKGKRVVIGCPKFDDGQAYVEKLAEILRQNEIRSLTVAIMEVPCCGGLGRIAELALQASGKMIPSQRLMVSVNGDIKRL